MSDAVKQIEAMFRLLYREERALAEEAYRQIGQELLDEFAALLRESRQTGKLKAHEAMGFHRLVVQGPYEFDSEVLRRLRKGHCPQRGAVIDASRSAGVPPTELGWWLAGGAES